MANASGPFTNVSTTNTMDSTPRIDELTPEQRWKLEEQMEAYKAIALQCFQKTRHRGIIQKDKLPSVTTVPVAPRAGGPTINASQPELVGMINDSIHEALIDQSGSLIMSLKPLIANCMKDTTQNLVAAGRIHEPSQYD